MTEMDIKRVQRHYNCGVFLIFLLEINKVAVCLKGHEGTVPEIDIWLHFNDYKLNTQYSTMQT